MKYKIAFSAWTPEGKIPPQAQLPADDTTWKRFNGSFQNQELDQVEILDMIYQGHPFTTWHKNQWRNAANYLAGQHIGLDWDTEDERSTINGLMKDSFIRKYAFLIYTTPSHKPEAPRARVVFLTDTPIMQAKNYVAAVSSLLWLFGTADRQCKDSCRFFYGSKDCQMEWLGQMLPIDKMKAIIGQYTTSGALAKKIATSKSYTPTTDQQEVAEALRAIPPWGIEYDEWLKILMGIHQAFGDAGLALAESWAQGADGEVARKWRSFKADGNPTGAVTINTVFKLARERGWKGNRVSQSQIREQDFCLQ